MIINNNEFEIPQQISMPTIPGYYYSSEVLTKEKWKDELESKNYIGTILGDTVVNSINRYIYYVRDSSTYPTLISQYLMPKDGYVYLLSSEVSTIGSLNIHRDCPAGRIAYFATKNNNVNEFEIIELKLKDNDKNRVWCDVFVAGKVQTGAKSVDELDIRSFNDDGKNKTFSQYISQDTAWGNIKSVWSSKDSQFLTNFNNLANKYIYLWEISVKVWNNLPPEYTSFENSRFQLKNWAKTQLGSAVSSDTQTILIRRELYRKGFHLASVTGTNKSEINGWYQIPGKYNLSKNGNYEYAENGGEYDVTFKKDSLGKYKLVKKAAYYVYAQNKGEYDVTFEKVNPPTKGDYKKTGEYYEYAPSEEGDIDKYNIVGVTRNSSGKGNYNLSKSEEYYEYAETGGKYSVEQAKNSSILDELDELGKPSEKQIVIHNRETWENIHILTAWWRVVINAFLKSTNDGPPIFNFYKNGNGWSGSNKNFCIKNDILNIAFTYRGQISVISHPNNNLFNGETYYNLPDSMLFSITTKNAHIFGGIGMYIGNFVDTKNNTYEIYTQSHTINDAANGGNGTTWLGDPIKNALVKIKINNINAIMSVNANNTDAKNERYKIYYSPSQMHPIVKLID